MTQLTNDLVASLNNLLNTEAAKQTFANIENNINLNVLSLIDDLSQATQPSEIKICWAKICMVLQKTYAVSRNNLSRNSILKAGLIDDLKLVTTQLLEDINKLILEKSLVLNDKKNLSIIFKLPLLVTKFYAVNDELDEYLSWRQICQDFVSSATLNDTYVEAEFNELQAEEISYHFPENHDYGSIDKSIDLFDEALQTYKILGATLISIDPAARHAQSGLCLAVVKKLLHVLSQTPVIYPELLQNIKSELSDVSSLLDQVEIYFLRTGINLQTLKESYYQTLDMDQDVKEHENFSNILMLRALVELLQGNINENTNLIFVKSLEMMPTSAVISKATIMNQYANFCLAYAAFIYAIHRNEHQDQLFYKLDSLFEHEYIMIGKKFSEFNAYYNNELLCDLILADADNLVDTAIQLYVSAFKLKPNDENTKYSQEAEEALVKIHRHPLCQANSIAMDIVNNALEMFCATRDALFFSQINNDTVEVRAEVNVETNNTPILTP